MNDAEFVTWIEKNEKRVTKGYKLGHDGHDGWCDCIGLIIGAWRLSGNTWNWTHGSNYTARYLVTDLGKNQDLHLGDLVFKGHQPGESGYNLPTQYKKGTDLTDYYHVGVVTSVSPLTIAHCTSGSKCRVWDNNKKEWVNRGEGGIKWDTTRGSWKYSAKFKYLSGSEEPMPDIMYVTSTNGLPVNMRRSASTSADIVTRIPVGSQVNVIGEQANGWTYVSYGAKKGYIMSKFLTDGTTQPTDPEPSGVLWQCVMSVRESIDKAEEHIAAAKVALTALEELAKNE